MKWLASRSRTPSRLASLSRSTRNSSGNEFYGLRRRR